MTGRYLHNTDAEELHWPLPPEQVTFVEKLRASGYWTAAGKWHPGNPAKARFDLVREANPAGFQLATGKDAKNRMTAEGSGAVQSGCDQWVPVLRDRPKDKPFFLWLAALDPHRDYEPGMRSHGRMGILPAVWGTHVSASYPASAGDETGVDLEISSIPDPRRARGRW